MVDECHFTRLRLKVEMEEASTMLERKRKAVEELNKETTELGKALAAVKKERSKIKQERDIVKKGWNDIEKERIALRRERVELAQERKVLEMEFELEKKSKIVKWDDLRVTQFLDWSKQAWALKVKAEEVEEQLRRDGYYDRHENGN
jgi:septal ring factor EnvC (AmiA/AmiB activator)